MSETTSNPATSENEIKIEMKFWEAVEITQKTYNNYQENADNDLDNLKIQELPTPEKWRFKLYNKFHDKDSNFSGMTFIYDDEKTNTVNVAIACRGSVKPSLCTEEGKKDWLHNNWDMLWHNNTDSDNFATDYATCILGKIKGDDKYKNKEINLITLGHSKGGREAQKQMLRLLDEQKNTNYINNIYCLTFNSAPCSKDDNKVKVDNCQNLITYDNLTLSADPLSYKDWLVSLFILLIISIITAIYTFSCSEFIIISIIALIATIILNLFKKCMQMTSGQIVLMMTFSVSVATILTSFSPFIASILDYKISFWQELIFVVFIIILFVCLRISIPKNPYIKLGKNCGNDCGYFVESADTLFNAHNLNSFWHEKSYYDDLKNMDVTEIIKLERKENLITLATKERKKREASANQTNVPKVD